MKFHRTARPLRSQFDMAPFACVFFLLVMFLMLGSITYKPGVRIDLPVAENFAGTDQASVTVAVDEGGRYYFHNQLLDAQGIKTNLINAVKKSREPLTLVVQADKAVTQERLLQLLTIAREAGIKDAWGATQPADQVVPAGKNSTLHP